MQLSFLKQDIIEQLIFGNQSSKAIAEALGEERSVVLTELRALEAEGNVFQEPWRYVGKSSEFFHYTQNGGMSDGPKG